MRDAALVALPAHQRIAARIADKYVSREGAAREREDTRRRQAEDVAMLEVAIENVRRGLGETFKGKAGRLAIARIEAVLVRDYALYSKIKPDNR